jgi:hypothetical protein
MLWPLAVLWKYRRKPRPNRYSDRGDDLLSRLESRCCFKLAGLMSKRVRTRFEEFSFGSIRIDGITYEYDVVIDQGNIRKRNKKPSKKFRDTYGHTPLSVDEDIPWKCERLVVGTGTGALPVMDEVKREARRRKIKLDILPTAEAIRTLQEAPEQTNAILHVTC